MFLLCQKPNIFLTTVDDFSRYTWAYLIKSKSYANTFLVFFYSIVNMQFSKEVKEVKRIRTNNGEEFTSNYMNSSMRKLGLSLKPCVQTPL